jgi:hypothetical protein
MLSNRTRIGSYFARDPKFSDEQEIAVLKESGVVYWLT